MTDFQGVDGTWSLDLITGLLVAALLIAILLIAGILTGRWAHANARDFDHDFVLWGSRVLFASVLVVVGVTACTTFPWESDYHRYEPKVGEVQAIEKRILSSGDGIEEKFAVIFNGVSGQYGCQDTRCALVKPGDQLALRCIKKWDYSATDGYDCRFVAHKKAGA